MVEKQSEAFHTFCGIFSLFKTEFYCISFFFRRTICNKIQIAFLKLHFWNSPVVSKLHLWNSPVVSDCIFEIHQLWQSGLSRVYSSFFCSCSFEPEIIKIGQSSHKMYSNNIIITRHEFKSETRLIAFHIALIPLGKVWIQLFSLQLWVNSRIDWFFSLGEAISLG